MKYYYTHTMLVVMALLLLQGLYSCQSESPSVAPIQPAPSNADFNNTRTAEYRGAVAAQAYYYRTLGSCVRGSTTMLNRVALQQLGKRPVNLVLLYDASASWAELLNADLPQATGNDKLNAIIDSYQLHIAKTFDIDAHNAGLVLEPKEKLEDPVEIARMLSLVEHVLMVNIKEVPTFEVMVIEENQK